MLRKPYSGGRYDDKYNRFRKAVLKRDKYKCQFPDCRSKTKLHVHHIIRWSDSISGRYNTSNALVLCRHHHNDVVTGHESHYQQLFFSIVKRNEEN